MPKRVIDGEALWTSRKLALVEPTSFRAEYANLLPLAEINGSFEAEPRLVWRTVYAANRPDVTAEQVEQILLAFSQAKMLFLWSKHGRKFGYFVGIEKHGRLPSPSRLKGKHYKLGPEVPYEELAEFLGQDTHRLHTGYTPATPGIGTGFGFGTGKSLDTPAVSVFSGLHLSVSAVDNRAFACAFPTVNLQGEYRKIDAWLEVNPAKRPRKQRPFVFNWLTRIPKDAPARRISQVRELVIEGPRSK